MVETKSAEFVRFVRHWWKEAYNESVDDDDDGGVNEAETWNVRRTMNTKGNMGGVEK